MMSRYSRKTSEPGKDETQQASKQTSNPKKDWSENDAQMSQKAAASSLKL
jgi:hypothetical protein